MPLPKIEVPNYNLNLFEKLSIIKKNCKSHFLIVSM